MTINTLIANYQDDSHKADIEFLLDSYARDEMGGGTPLDEKIKGKVVHELSKLKHAFSVLAYSDGKAVGLANCFESFSTFACKPLINIHDLVVVENYRGNGISHIIMNKIEEIAISKGCCKITLEVLSNNEVAKSSYLKFGFSGYCLKPESGSALFWQKLI